MELKNIVVSHRTFGFGKIIDVRDSYITVLFSNGEKTFVFPDAFSGFLRAIDPELNGYFDKLIKEKEEQMLLLQVEKEKQLIDNQLLGNKEQDKNKIHKHKKTNKTYDRRNIAFKCNFCNGGRTGDQIGFCGVCSDEIIEYNVEKEKHIWCSNEDSPCYQYLNDEISRKELDGYMRNDRYVCYECQMLKNWTAFSGFYHNGEREGNPMILKHVQLDSLCVLTTREPYASEDDRLIFAVFLVDDAYSGDACEPGHVSTNSEYKIKLSLNEARNMTFWKYHANKNREKIAAWGSGLHRYLEDIESAQILRDIAIIKKGTRDEALADRFLRRFCLLTKIDIDDIPEPNGALIR